MCIRDRVSVFDDRLVPLMVIQESAEIPGWKLAPFKTPPFAAIAGVFADTMENLSLIHI